MYALPGITPGDLSTLTAAIIRSGSVQCLNRPPECSQGCRLPGWSANPAPIQPRRSSAAREAASQRHPAFVYKTQNSRGVVGGLVGKDGGHPHHSAVVPLTALHVPVQGAVELVFGAELVEAGDLLPILAGRGDDVFGRGPAEEALQVPLGELFGVLGAVQIDQAALLLNVRSPELELLVADGGGAPSQAVEQKVGQHDGGDEQPAQDLWSHTAQTENQRDGLVGL